MRWLFDDAISGRLAVILAQGPQLLAEQCHLSLEQQNVLLLGRKGIVETLNTVVLKRQLRLEFTNISSGLIFVHGVHQMTKRCTLHCPPRQEQRP